MPRVNQRVLRAVQIVVDEGLAKPILLVVQPLLKTTSKVRHTLEHGVNIEIVDQENNFI